MCSQYLATGCLLSYLSGFRPEEGFFSPPSRRHKAVVSFQEALVMSLPVSGSQLC